MNTARWKRDVMGQFDENWHRVISKKSSWLNYTHERRLQVIDSLVDENGLLLDIGAGDGGILFYVTERKIEFSIGIDISEKMIKLTKHLMQERDISNVDLLIADAENLPFSNNSFDVVYCAATIEHTPNPERVIQEMARVVKNGKKIIVITPNPIYGMAEKISTKFRHSTMTKRRLTKAFIRNNIDVTCFSGFIFLLPFRYTLLEKMERILTNTPFIRKHRILNYILLNIMVDHVIVGIKAQRSDFFNNKGE